MKEPYETAPGITLKPIGRVRNEVKKSMRYGWEEVVSELVLAPDLSGALEGLEGFSHIIVLFWMHGLSPQERQLTKVHPQRREDLPLVGVFATRSPARPNPIGVAVARLLGREGNVLRVKGLDALDGTPILDIKPYLPGDSVAETGVPEWVSKLQGPCA